MHGGVGLQHLGLGLSVGSIRVRVSRSCPRYVPKCLYTGLALCMVYIGHLWTGLANRHSFRVNVIFVFRVRLGLGLRLVFRVRV